MNARKVGQFIEKKLFTKRVINEKKFSSLYTEDWFIISTLHRHVLKNTLLPFQIYRIERKKKQYQRN